MSTKLENWGDLFKYSKELLDDDYNHGQALVVKTKSRGDDNLTVRNLNFGVIPFSYSILIQISIGIKQHLQTKHTR